MCEYCDKQYDNKPVIGDGWEGTEITRGNILEAYGDCTGFGEARINYCPMCGRKLVEAK
jgi:hypothetical protein